MALERFIPKSPDPFIRNSQDFEVAKFGHLNTIIEYINSYVVTDSLQLAGSGPITSTARYITDSLGNASAISISTTRVGIGTTAPSNILHLNLTNVNGMRQSTADGYIQSFYQNAYGTGVFMYNVNSFSFPSNDLAVGNPISLGARLSIKGSGSTSATTSLLVQNSAGSTAFKVKDNLSIGIGGGLDGGDGIRIVAGNNSEIVFTQGPDRVSLTRTNGDSLAIGTGGGVTYIKDGICNDGSNINFWKFEGAINSTVAMDTTKYLKVYVAGVPYKIAVCV